MSPCSCCIIPARTGLEKKRKFDFDDKDRDADNDSNRDDNVDDGDCIGDFLPSSMSTITHTTSGNNNVNSGVQTICSSILHSNDLPQLTSASPYHPIASIPIASLPITETPAHLSTSPPIAIEFRLKSGTYATALLRELTGDDNLI